MRQAFKRLMENFKKDERGLTLVELLAVIVILAIVGLIAFVAIGNVIENSKQDAHVANAQQVISAGELFVASGGDHGEITNASDLDTVNEGDLIDPWDNEKTYDFDLEFSASEEDNTVNITVTSEHEKCGFSNKDKVSLASEGREACD